MSAHRSIGVYQPRSRRGQLADALAEFRQYLLRLVFETARRATGLALIAGAVALLLAIATFDATDPSFDVASAHAVSNWLGRPGSYSADLLLEALGVAALGLAVPMGAWGWRMAMGRRVRQLVLRMIALFCGEVLFAAGLGALPGLAGLPAGTGGVTGELAAILSARLAALFAQAWIVAAAPVLIGISGLFLVLAAADIGWHVLAILWRTMKTMGCGMLALIRLPVHFARARAAASGQDEWDETDEEEEDEKWDDDVPTKPDAEGVPGLNARVERLAQKGREKRVLRPDDRRKNMKTKTNLQPALNLAEGEYQLPPLSLLTRPPAESQVPAYSDDALEENARMLESVLSDFGVRGRVVAVRPGPVVTLYEFEPAAGVKSSRVISLADDIARSMSAVAARVAVIPGRNVIGIELPNQKRETVYLRELFSAQEYEKSRAPLTLALGKTIGGDCVMADLAKMPHLLIAGTTGSGKSVALNTMILSLLYRMPPEHCRLILIDPKMLELSVYDDIPHLLAPVVIDPKKAVVALKWAVKEMESRYAKMAKVGVRGIEAFNDRLKKARDRGEVLKRTVQTGFDRETGTPVYEDEILELDPMPFIVVVVDEMADLMMISGKEIEGAVQRLAQMARAAGIHLIAATQRPSVDVITGTIKANFPTRISFQVTSKIDSRTILGEQGAEQLLGQGDMLYMMAGGRIRRVHGPFVSDSEVEEVVRFLKAQGRPDYLDAVTEEQDDDEDDPYNLYGGGEGGDELFDKAVAIVAHERKVSTSYIQRRLQIGYNRAARLIERMEEEGMISKPNHQGKREILLPDARE
jgi:DNA segregation ATPase FtsK/SpoIIIE, S-DNA-T family